MKKLVFYISCFMITSCSLPEKKIYKNLYISNGGEFSDYPTAVIKLEDGYQLNILPFEVRDYEIEDKYIVIKCIDYYNENRYYLIDKNFDEYNVDNKIEGPFTDKEFEKVKKVKKFNF